VTLFLAKLLFTPVMMFLASAAGRRWGPGIAGWLTGLPLLAGPISAFICIEQGPAFAEHAAAATLLGMWSSCAFCLAYAGCAGRGWVIACVAAVAAFAVVTAALHAVHLAPWIGFLGVMAGATLCLATIKAPGAALRSARPPRWDMPARLTIAAAMVLLQTAIAGWLGPQLSGLIMPFPTLVILLTAFAHHQIGSDGARSVLRGFLLGMYAFAMFFVVLAAGLARWSPLPAYVVALAACVAVNGMTLAWLRRGATR
jgi:hypothetical protein